MKNASISGNSWFYIRDEIILKNFLFSIGPLAIGVDASQFTFQNYKTGVYNDTSCSSTFINHAMTLVSKTNKKLQFFE